MWVHAAYGAGHYNHQGLFKSFNCSWKNQTTPEMLQVPGSPVASVGTGQRVLGWRFRSGARTRPGPGPWPSLVFFLLLIPFSISVRPTWWTRGGGQVRSLPIHASRLCGFLVVEPWFAGCLLSASGKSGHQRLWIHNKGRGIRHETWTAALSELMNTWKRPAF